MEPSERLGSKQAERASRAQRPPGGSSWVGLEAVQIAIRSGAKRRFRPPAGRQAGSLWHSGSVKVADKSGAGGSIPEPRLAEQTELPAGANESWSRPTCAATKRPQLAAAAAAGGGERRKQEPASKQTNESWPSDKSGRKSALVPN